jgi:hypothetical protein
VSEIVRIDILHASSGLLVETNKNYKKEQLLFNIFKNFELYKGCGFFIALGNVYHWKINKIVSVVNFFLKKKLLWRVCVFIF